MKYGTLCFVDHGLFNGFASKLSKEGGGDWENVIYTTQWQSSYPSSNQHDIGQGVPGLDVYDDLWAAVKDDLPRLLDPEEHDDEGYLLEPSVDLFCVADLYYSNVADVLRHLGYRVWSAGQAEELEIDRIESKRILKRIDESIVGPYEIRKGTDALESYLREHKGEHYIKGSKTRADFESQEAKSLPYVQEWIRKTKYNLGRRADSFEFIIEAKLKGCIEAAADGFTVDGRFPTQCNCGVESKGRGYVGVFSRDIPTQFSEINAGLAPYLRKHKARTFMAIETLIDEDAHPYPTDPCERLGLPSGPSQQANYKNLSEIMLKGAGGELVEPQPNGDYVAEIVLLSVSHDWQRIRVPKELEPYTYIVNACKVGGDYHWMPQPSLQKHEGLATIGTVTCVGKTFEAATKGAMEYAEEIVGSSPYLEVADDAFGKIAESFEALEKRGVPLA